MGSASLSVVVVNGASTFFWTDRWAPIGLLNLFAPALYRVTSRAGRTCLLRDAVFDNRWARDITGATTVQLLRDFFRVWVLLRSVVLEPSQPDKFVVWKWSADGSYSSRATYKAFFAGATELLGAKELWKVKAPPRLKLFFWYVLHRWLWTSERRARHGLQENVACALCLQAPETCDHLFLGCVVFARQLWVALLQPLQLSSLTPAHEQSLGPWWIQQRRVLDRASRPVFDLLMSSLPGHSGRKETTGCSSDLHPIFRQLSKQQSKKSTSGCLGVLRQSAHLLPFGRKIVQVCNNVC